MALLWDLPCFHHHQLPDGLSPCLCSFCYEAFLEEIIWWYIFCIKAVHSDSEYIVAFEVFNTLLVDSCNC